MKIVILFALSFVLVNCAREKKAQTRVTIELPPAQSSSEALEKTDFSALTSSISERGVFQPEPISPMAVDLKSWGSQQPIGYFANIGINCYMVTVSEVTNTTPAEPVGPQAHKCTSKTKTALDMTFSDFDGPVAVSRTQSTELSLMLEMNKTYRFSLIGFNAPIINGVPLNCRKIKLAGIKRNELSNPYLVASEVKTLSSNADVTLNLSTFKPDNRFDDCEFAGFATGRELNTLVPEDIVITKKQFPASVAATISGGCYPLDFQLLNRDGELLKIVQQSTLNLERMTTHADCYSDGFSSGNCTGWSSEKTFQDAESCAQFSNVGDSTFEVASSEVTRWVRVNASADLTAADYFRVLKNGNVFNKEIPYITHRSNSTTDLAFDILGPSRPQVGQCIPYTVMVRKYGGDHYATDLLAKDIEVDADGSDGSVYETLSNCKSKTSPILKASPVSWIFSSNQGYIKTIYVRAQGVGVTKNIELEDDSNLSPNLNASSFSYKATGGDFNPSKLNIISNKVQTTLGHCMGPFQVVLENNIGAAIPNPNVNPIVISLSSTATSAVFYTSSTAGSMCSGSTSTSLSIAKDGASAQFFMKVLTSSPVLANGNYVIEASTPAGSAVSLSAGTYGFNLFQSP